MSTQFVFDGPDDARTIILLAHGAGAPMDSQSMNTVAKAFAAAGFRVARFEFAYMAARRTGEGRKPPPKAERLLPEYLAAVDDLGPTNGPLIIGGKSMGGRVASMVADPLFEAGRIAGLLCLGYPFHPPAKPNQLRTLPIYTARPSSAKVSEISSAHATKWRTMRFPTPSRSFGWKMETTISNHANRYPASRRQTISRQ